jgi:hypothetical protein
MTTAVMIRAEPRRGSCYGAVTVMQQGCPPQSETRRVERQGSTGGSARSTRELGTAWGLSVLAMAPCTLAALLALMTWSAACGAEDKAEAAGRLFEEASKAFASKDYAAAARAFDRANQWMPHGATKYNAAKAWEAAGQAGRAAQAYSDALQMEGLSKTQASDARDRLTELSKEVSRVDVVAPAGARVWVADIAGGRSPIRTYLPRGKHSVRVVFSDQRSETVRITVGTEPQVVNIVPPPEGQDSAEVKRSEAPKPEPVVEDSSSVRPWGWVALAAAGVSAGAAIGLGIGAVSARDEFSASGNKDRSAHDRAETLQNWTNVSWVATGVFGAAGAIVLLTTSPSKTDASHKPAASRLSYGVGLTGVSVDLKW